MNLIMLGHTGSIGHYIFNKYKNQGFNITGYSSKDFNAESDSDVKNIAEKIRNTKKIDGFINCMGVVDLPEYKNVVSFNKLLNINLKAAFALSVAAAENMKSHKSGSIINIGSIASNNVRIGRVGYTATKAGLEGLTRALAIEYAQYNIKINCVAPGPTETDLLRNTLSKKDFKNLITLMPMQNLVQPNDFYTTVDFILTKNNCITGQTIVVDGGLSIKSNF